VKLPADVGVISQEKLHDYILSPTHPDGRGKAAYLSRLGYSQTDWLRLEHDLRAQHLILDAAPGRPSLYGTKYEIVGWSTPVFAHFTLEANDLVSERRRHWSDCRTKSLKRVSAFALITLKPSLMRTPSCVRLLHSQPYREGLRGPVVSIRRG